MAELTLEAALKIVESIDARGKARDEKGQFIAQKQLDAARDIIAKDLKNQKGTIGAFGKLIGIQKDTKARLEAKLKTAKAVNYSGFAVNGSSIFVLLFGVHHFIMDPSTIELINLIETTFGIDIPYERFVEIVELWKAQIMSLCGSVQVGFMYYKQTRQRMKDADTEDTWAFINEELEKL